MLHQSIKVKVLKETSKTVTIHMMSLNRKMPVPRQEFEKRVKQGLYVVLNAPEEAAEEEK